MLKTLENKEILEQIGLNKHESSVYLKLLELGPSTISVISESVGIHRPIAYKILPQLEEKQLITKITKGKQTLYVAEPPSKLESIFRDLKLQFFDMLPELEGMYGGIDKRPVVRYLKGKKGITSVFEEIVNDLKRGETFYRYSSSRDSTKGASYLPKNFREIRDRKKLNRKVIMGERRATEKSPSLERFVKVIPKSIDPFDQNITHIIYGSRVAFIDYNSETAIVIESTSFAIFQKKIFEILYSKL